ncbi:hypothetical protein [Rubrivirga sp.]|uniref:hypothetical protein n=1 Tax=Rubrivirga sp. TaxID=1885344 RepID=UPI003B52E527
MIGDPGAFDFLTSAPMGLFPGFRGFTHPVGGEQNAINTFANANMHNFRAGVWIAARDVTVPGPPPAYSPQPADYELFVSGGSEDTYGTTAVLPPLALQTNYLEDEGFDPRLPEEWTETTWETSLGLTTTRRSSVWGFPGYADFIVYDYTFENTGRVVSTLTGEVVPDPAAFQQTLEDVYIGFHGAVSVSTKSQINFHSDLTAVQAGAFGWKPPYHDYYQVSDDRTLAFSYNYNGGAEPTPFNTYPVKDGQAWRQKFGPELMSPAAFGWLALSAPTLDGTGQRATPSPDVLRVDVFKGGQLLGSDLDLEFFTTNGRPKKAFHDFLMTPTRQEQLGNEGNRSNFYTHSYGPYSIEPGETLRFVIAEIAGVMDYREVIAGDPDGHFPDSTIAAIQRNADLARQAVAWGIGASVDGFEIAADVPEPPPAPQTDAVNASTGTDEAAIAVTWTDVAETTTVADGSGGAFYDGRASLDGYRIYRSTDFQFTSDTEEPVFRGAAWDLVADVPIAEAGQYLDAELGRYRFVDEAVEFGRRYGYYVAAYDSDPAPWTSANGTVVTDLPELVSGSYNRSQATAALAGPVASFDVYAVPNPFVFGDAQRSFGLNDPYRIEFRNLPERATIRIYTVAGDLIRTIEHGPDARGNLFGTTGWDQKSDSGLLVAPGLYVFHVRSQTDGLEADATGKIVIVR